MCLRSTTQKLSLIVISSANSGSFLYRCTCQGVKEFALLYSLMGLRVDNRLLAWLKNGQNNYGNTPLFSRLLSWTPDPSLSGGIANGNIIEEYTNLGLASVFPHKPVFVKSFEILFNIAISRKIFFSFSRHFHLVEEAVTVFDAKFIYRASMNPSTHTVNFSPRYSRISDKLQKLVKLALISL